ncbi:hypothetical protein M3Y95_00615700 [Aphelenchoides besseyi]|nr:hypothetical protein M3Y95_00615700 [Aphelenchoides besseyi]
MTMEAENWLQIFFVGVSIFGATLLAGTTQCSKKKPPLPPIQPTIVVSTAPGAQVPAEGGKKEKSKKEKSKKSEKTKSGESKERTNKKTLAFVGENGEVFGKNKKVEVEMKVEPTKDETKDDEQKAAEKPKEMNAEEKVEKKVDVAKVDDKKPEPLKNVDVKTTEVGKNDDVIGKDKKTLDEKKVVKEETKEKKEVEVKKSDGAIKEDKKQEPPKNADIKAPTDLNKKAHTYDPNYQTLAMVGKNDAVFGQDKKVEPAKPLAAIGQDKKVVEVKKVEPTKVDEKKQEPPKNADIKAPADLNKKAHTYDPNYQTLAQVGKNDAVFGKDKKITELKKDDKKVVEPVKLDVKKPEQMKQIQARANQNLKAHTYDPNYQTLAMVGKNDAIFGKDKKVIEVKKEDKKVEPAKVDDKKPVVAANKVEEKKPEQVKQIQAPANQNLKAHTYDPQYQITDLKDGKKVEPAKVDDKKQEPAKNADIKAPTDVNKKAHTYDPNYQTLAMVGKNDAVFGKDKKAAEKPKVEPAKPLPTGQEKKEVKK